eukprot:1032115-Prymnesium_polylepis.1
MNHMRAPVRAGDRRLAHGELVEGDDHPRRGVEPVERLRHVAQPVPVALVRELHAENHQQVERVHDEVVGVRLAEGVRHHVVEAGAVGGSGVDVLDRVLAAKVGRLLHNVVEQGDERRRERLHRGLGHDGATEVEEHGKLRLVVVADHGACDVRGRLPSTTAGQQR